MLYFVFLFVSCSREFGCEETRTRQCGKKKKRGRDGPSTAVAYGPIDEDAAMGTSSLLRLVCRTCRAWGLGYIVGVEALEDLVAAVRPGFRGG